MARLLLTAYLLAHGFVHIALYVLPPDPAKPQPYDPHRSWMLAHAHAPAGVAVEASVMLAWMTASAFALAAVALGAGAAWWPAAAVLAAALGLVFKAAWFHPWLTLGVTLDVALIAAVVVEWPGSLY